MSNNIVSRNMIVRNNIFEVATGALVRIDEYSEEYSHAFEGNTYVQSPAKSQHIAYNGIDLNYKTYRPLTIKNVVTFLGDDAGIVD